MEAAPAVLGRASSPPRPAVAVGGAVAGGLAGEIVAGIPQGLQIAFSTAHGRDLQDGQPVQPGALRAHRLESSHQIFVGQRPVFLTKTGNRGRFESLVQGARCTLGQPVSYNSVSWDAYWGFGFPGAEDLGSMFQFYHDCEKDFAGARSLEVSQSLNPELQLLEQWLTANKNRIPLD